MSNMYIPQEFWLVNENQANYYAVVIRTCHYVDEEDQNNKK